MSTFLTIAEIFGIPVAAAVSAIVTRWLGRRGAAADVDVKEAQAHQIAVGTAEQVVGLVRTELNVYAAQLAEARVELRSQAVEIHTLRVQVGELTVMVRSLGGDPASIFTR